MFAVFILTIMLGKPHFSNFLAQPTLLLEPAGSTTTIAPLSDHHEKVGSHRQLPVAHLGPALDYPTDPPACSPRCSSFSTRGRWSTFWSGRSGRSSRSQEERHLFREANGRRGKQFQRGQYQGRLGKHGPPSRLCGRWPKQACPRSLGWPFRARGFLRQG